MDYRLFRKTKLMIVPCQDQDTGVAVLKGDFNGNITTVVVHLFGKPAIISAASQKSATPQKQETLLEKPNQSIEVNPQGAADAMDAKTVQGESAPGRETPAVFAFLNFVNANYYDSIRKVIYFSLIFVIVVLLMNIFIRIDIQHPDLILKTLGFVALLVVFSAIDKMTLINLIPHNFSIH